MKKKKKLCCVQFKKAHIIRIIIKIKYKIQIIKPEMNRNLRFF